MKKIHFKALDMKFIEKVKNEKGEDITRTVWRKIKYNPAYFAK
jgi:hypothetical protein